MDSKRRTHTPHAGWPRRTSFARKMRREPTRAEQVLWDRLRARRIAGVKFRRQHQIGPFIVDFYAVDVGLVVELDGEPHKATYEEDQKRTAFLEEHSLRVVRFDNDAVLRRTDEVARRIEEAIVQAPPLQTFLERGPGGEE